MSEQEIQDSISDLLSGLGFTVLHTNTHGVRGPTGVSRGVPDLLVYHKEFPSGVSIGLEVKKPKGWKWSSYEQWEAWENKRTKLVFSPHCAVMAVWDAYDMIDPFAHSTAFSERLRGAASQLPACEYQPPEDKKVPPMTAGRRR